METQIKMSYAILVCNEHRELNLLLTFLNSHTRDTDEVIIVCDESNTTEKVKDVLSLHQMKMKNIQIFQNGLNNDFSQQKNFLKSKCNGDFIFQIDADEIPSEYLMQVLPQMLEQNSDIDLFWIPRINIVKGLTPIHISKWGWKVDEKNRINFPDYQSRVIKNRPEIEWKNKVHEVITGHMNQAFLPGEDDFCLTHEKEIIRQEKQNELYNKINKGK